MDEKKIEPRRKFDRLLSENPKLKKTVGVFLVVVGLIALLTPLTPGSWLIIIGLEFLGLRFLLLDRIKKQFEKWKGNSGQ